MKKGVSLGLACLFAVSAARADTGDPGKPGFQARRAAAVCDYFQSEATRFRNSGKRPEEIGAQELCFDVCKAGQVPASKFWGSLDTPESREIHEELLEYADVYTLVTKVDMQGGASKQIRLARIVGSARCQHDTYLEHTPAGFRRISSPVLDAFSEEAGRSCGAGEIYFSHYRGMPYAIDTYAYRFEAYEIGRGYKLTKVCSVPANDRFSLGETGLDRLPVRLERAMRHAGTIGASHCKLVGKRIHLRTNASFYVASISDDCEMHSPDSGDHPGKIWILADSAKPKVIFSGEAESLYVRDETSNGLPLLEISAGGRDVSFWAFDGQRFVKQF